jgi:hypothetical protein
MCTGVHLEHGTLLVGSVDLSRCSVGSVSCIADILSNLYILYTHGLQTSV